MVNRPLPAGIDDATLDAFFNEVAECVGEANISRDPSKGNLPGPQGQESYGDLWPLDRDHTPSGAVRAGSVEEIQHILKIANKYSVPLWTVSRGKNLGYGGSSPVVKGSVVLDLQRMNKIIEINEEYAYAIVEPGVTFFDLYEEIKRRGYKLWPSAPSLGWGSVLGNTLERGFGYTPDGEHSQSQCGMEVVLPNGDLVRTGMGAIEGSSLFPLFKGGFGPSVDGLFFQSNLGVVTKMGVHITPAPEAYIRVEICIPEEKDLAVLTATLTDLLRRRILSQSPTVMGLMGVVSSCIQDPEVFAKLEPYLNKNIPDTVLLEIQALKKLPFWAALLSLYGTREVVDAQLATLTRELATKTDGRAFIISKPFYTRPGQTLPADIIGDEPELVPQTGRPTLFSLSKLNGGGHGTFAPVIPPSGRELYDWYLEAKRVTSAAGFNFIADFHLFPRHTIAIGLFMFQPQFQSAAVHALLTRLADITAKRGFSEYRTHTAFMDDVASHHTFNRRALSRFTSQIKDLLDPRGILSPGKQGVWNSTDLRKGGRLKQKL